MTHSTVSLSGLPFRLPLYRQGAHNVLTRAADAHRVAWTTTRNGTELRATEAELATVLRQALLAGVDDTDAALAMARELDSLQAPAGVPVAICTQGAAR